MDWFKTAVEVAGGPAAVARASGLSTEHVCNLLAGRRRLTADTVRLLAPVLESVEADQWVEATLGPAFITKAAPKKKRQGRGRLQADVEVPS